MGLTPGVEYSLGWDFGPWICRMALPGGGGLGGGPGADEHSQVCRAMLDPGLFVWHPRGDPGPGWSTRCSRPGAGRHILNLGHRHPAAGTPGKENCPGVLEAAKTGEMKLIRSRWFERFRPRF